jgi:hypothetical protein
MNQCIGEELRYNRDSHVHAPYVHLGVTQIRRHIASYFCT